MARSSQNRGFLYGDGFFETMRIENQDIPLWSWHILRAKKAAKFLECEWPVVDEESLKLEIIKNQPKDCPIVRLDFYRAGEGTYIPNSNSLEVTYDYRPLTARSSYFFSGEGSFEKIIEKLQPINLQVFRDVVKPLNAVSSFKSSSAILYVKAGLFLKRNHTTDDVVLLNSEGRICEALSSNIILKKGNRWYGVAQEEGPVDGVYQRYLRTYLDIDFTSIDLEDLQAADIILLTNAATGITVAQLVG